ncbi:hypothetical protein ACHAO4_002386 [Trichoderma viride]
MFNPNARRPRVRILLLIILASVTSYYLLFSGPSPRFNIVPYLPDQRVTQGTQPNTPASQTPVGDNKGDDQAIADVDDGSIQDGKPSTDEKQHEDESPKEEEKEPLEPEQEKEEEKPLNMDIDTYNKELEMLESWDLNIEDLRQWKDPDDKEDPKDVAPGYETDGKDRDSGTISRLQHEKDMRKMWRYAYKTTANLESSNKIYGNTLSTLDYKANRTEALEEKLREDPDATVGFSVDKPVRFNPYPDYNSETWKNAKHASYVPCKGPSGEIVQDLLVFKGRPHNFPEPKFGSYSLFNMDPNLCWERDTRLGPYGLLQQTKKVGGEVEIIDWENVNWGDLVQRCVQSNAARFDLSKEKKNEYLSVYPDVAESLAPKKDDKKDGEASKASEAQKDKEPSGEFPNLDDKTLKIKGRSPADPADPDAKKDSSDVVKEKRSAVLLRSYTGKVYTENDKETIRAMISELSLKTGGEFEIFLLVQVKDKDITHLDDPEVYRSVLQKRIPVEFHGITLLWNDQQVWDIYTKLTDDNERSVHTAQWLSVQKFSIDHPEFDYIWNWEMDFRVTGHHYDMVDNLAKFSAKQPRRGSWERNERWYIPEHHGDYDTTFRKEVEETYGESTVWGAPDLPFITPVGPKPPVKLAEEDNYSWGVGEEADFITLGPIFDPVNSNWIIRDNVWGYSDKTHKARDLPRRTTIVTHSRLSKRLLDIMHVENLRGNHVASEMTPQTVALLHGLKAVYAPHPIFTDRDWNGKFLDQWFNPGPKGESGGYGSPMGWGRERRYQGNSWYYRAEPPNRMYNNWMGWIDTGMGGQEWEQQHGRPCLPSILLHPVKDTKATKEGHKTGFELFYG